MTALTCWRGLLVLVPVLGSITERSNVWLPISLGSFGIREDLKRLVASGRRQVQVVVDELAEGVAEVGQALSDQWC